MARSMSMLCIEIRVHDSIVVLRDEAGPGTGMVNQLILTVGNFCI